MGEEEGAVFLEVDGGAAGGFAVGGTPFPGVAKPEGGEEVKGGCVWAVVGGGDAPEDVFGGAFGDFLGDVEVAVFIEDAGVGEFDFFFLAGGF